MKMLLQYLLPCLILVGTVLANDGFMQDFFTRFPNLPFGNMNSFKTLHDRSPMTVPNSLISNGDSGHRIHEIRKRKNIFQKKPKIKTAEETVSVTVKEIQSTTTRSTTSKGKHRILYKSTKSYVRKTTVGPSTVTKVDKLKYYNNFNIVSTTPSYGLVNQLPKYGKSKIDEVKQSFYFYEDKYSSHKFVYPPEDIFATQLGRPKLVAEQQFFAYDPFRQKMSTTSKPEDTTLEKLFYYGDTKPMYKARNMKKKKKGIVINEKAASGEVNVMESEDLIDSPEPMTVEEITTTSTEPSTTTTTRSTTLSPTSVSQLPKLRSKTKLYHYQPITPPTTTKSTTLSPTSVSQLPKLSKTKLYYYHPNTPSTTKSTTLSPTSVSRLPKLRSKTKLYHYRHPNTGMMYSPLMYRPLDSGEAPPTTTTTPKPNKRKYTYTTVTTHRTKFGPPITELIVMPPYTPAPTTTTTTTTTPVYFTPEYSSEDFGPFTADDPESETVGGQDDIDDKKYSYKYKVLQGHVNHVTGHEARPPPYHSIRYPPPPPPYAHLPHLYPYPFYKYYQSYNHLEESKHNPYDTSGFKYHSKIKYTAKEEEKPQLKYKYSSPVIVNKTQHDKYLPHNQIIKATFYQDKEKEKEEKEKEAENHEAVSVADLEDDSLAKELESEVSKNLTRFKRKKHPLYRRPYRREGFSSPSITLDRSDQELFGDELFQANLKKIMENQFFIHPSDFLTGFVPVHSFKEKMRKSARPNGNLEKVNVNTKINASLKPSSVLTPTTRSPLSATKLLTMNIDKNKVERKTDLRTKYLDLNRRKGKQTNFKEEDGVLNIILQKYGNKHKYNNNILPKEIFTRRPDSSMRQRFTNKTSPVQSIKENLISRFLRHFTKDPPEIQRGQTDTNTERAETPKPSRLPQRFLQEFEKKGNRGTSPPSSQASYQNFLRKLREKGRNES